MQAAPADNLGSPPTNQTLSLEVAYGKKKGGEMRFAEERLGLAARLAMNGLP